MMTSLRLLTTFSGAAAAALAPPPTTLLGGFLGAGKTSVLSNILKNRDGLKIAGTQALNEDNSLMTPERCLRLFKWHLYVESSSQYKLAPPQF